MSEQIFPDNEHPFDPEKLTEFLPLETWSNKIQLPVRDISISIMNNVRTQTNKQTNKQKE
jgi:hypothetical protein